MIAIYAYPINYAIYIYPINKEDKLTTIPQKFG